MKNKKGFTLVELLAVIAILAIMVIIALPNVLNMFNSGRKSAFETEVKNIYSAAEKEYINDALSSSGNKIYSYCKSGGCGKDLKLSGGKNIEYYIEFDSGGNVIRYYVTNGDYQYTYQGNGLKITDINDVDYVPNLSEDNVLVINDSGDFIGEIPYISVYHQEYEGRLSVGDELYIGNEHFIIIETNPSTTKAVVKYNLQQHGVQNSTTTFKSSYMTSNYWLENAGPGKAYPGDNDPNTDIPYPYIYDSNSYLYNFVEYYVDILKSESGVNDISGRLLSYEEAASTSPEILGIGKTYFLGSCGGSRGFDRSIFYVTEDGEISDESVVLADGVHPVIIFNTSDIKVIDQFPN